MIDEEEEEEENEDDDFFNEYMDFQMNSKKIIKNCS